MHRVPVTIDCSGPQGDGKKRMLLVLVQALAQRGMRVGVLRHRGSGAAVRDDAYVAAGASAHIDMHAGTVALAPALKEPGSCDGDFFSNCHVLLADVDSCGSRPGVVLEIRGEDYAGFGLLSPDASRMAEHIRRSFVAPLVSGAVLAGGRSSRLGRNKALLPLNGTTVIEKVIDEVRACVSDLTLITNSPDEYTHLCYPCRPDMLPGGGPLSGIHAALTHCGTEYVLVVSCDIPLINRTFFERLLAALPGYDIVIFKHRQFEPLCALYRRTCLPALEELIAHGDYRIIDLFPSLRVKVLRTDSAEPFRSINTDADYESVMRAASAALEAAGAGGTS
ncbi:MAG: molybdenum cofactor guanylyltransferase [Deltaproteobacteria bacterium]|nr:molybdenum cofactor guanylyltransferase [Deltaproteobacteria bacterium]